MPGLTNVDHIAQVDNLLIFFERHGVDVRAGRLPIYKRVLLSFGELNGVFDPLNNEVHARAYDEMLYVLREVHELMWIMKGFNIACPPGTDKLLEIVNGGKPFAKDDLDCRARNFQFEMRIASYFLQQGYSVDLSGDADVIAEDNEYIFYVECKRLNSPKQVDRRVKDAAKQLRRRVIKSTSLKHKATIAAFDITKIAFPHLGLTWGFTPDHCKENITKRKLEVSSTFDFVGPFQADKSVVGIWLFVHMPAAVLTTGQASTRFSSLFHVLKPHSEAFRRFRKVYEVGKYESWGEPEKMCKNGKPFK